MKYDIIGDVHGQAQLLERLLKKLGYQPDLTGAWFHPQRKALFVGDLINKGPEVKRTVKIVRRMVDGGYAETIIGNHELAWIEGEEDRISSTIRSYQNDPGQFKSDLEWIRTLPFFLEKEEIRIVHAYWDKNAIRQIIFWESRNSFDQLNDQEPYRMATSLLTNGPQYQVSTDEGIMHDQFQKSRMKLRWWNIDLPLYGLKEKPLFFGHYCLLNGPEVAQGNICCLDTCNDQILQLAAYRWNGEKELKTENLIVVTQQASL